jgi:hypothetical protein
LLCDKSDVGENEDVPPEREEDFDAVASFVSDSDAVLALVPLSDGVAKIVSDVELSGESVPLADRLSDASPVSLGSLTDRDVVCEFVVLLLFVGTSVGETVGWDLLAVGSLDKERVWVGSGDGDALVDLVSTYVSEGVVSLDWDVEIEAERDTEVSGDKLRESDIVRAPVTDLLELGEGDCVGMSDAVTVTVMSGVSEPLGYVGVIPAGEPDSDSDPVGVPDIDPDADISGVILESVNDLSPVIDGLPDGDGFAVNVPDIVGSDFVCENDALAVGWLDSDKVGVSENCGTENECEPEPEMVVVFNASVCGMCTSATTRTRINGCTRATGFLSTKARASRGDDIWTSQQSCPFGIYTRGVRGRSEESFSLASYYTANKQKHNPLNTVNTSFCVFARGIIL